MKYFRTIARILVGLVFIFSSLVKGVDPMGTAYRITDYFLVFGMPWATGFSAFLSVFLCTLEFALGISLLFNLLIRQTSWILLLMMTFFTVLTFFDARYNMVPDCGCFGDVLKLTNLQTFLKNIALMLFVIPIFIFRKRYKGWAPVKAQAGIFLLFASLFAGMSVHALYHLPVIDFLPWKEGNTVNKQDLKPVKFFVTYKNKQTGEEKEYLMPNYPWNDSVWMATWVFKSQRAEDPNKGSMTLRIEDAAGNDVTANVLDNPDPNFIIVSYDLTNPGKEVFRDILYFSEEAMGDGKNVVLLTSSGPAVIEKFRNETHSGFEFYLADDVVLKMMVRANPGVIMLKNGVVVEKWNHRDLPLYQEIKKKYGI